MIAHPLALRGGVAFIPFAYVFVVSPMAQFLPRGLLRWIKREGIWHCAVELGAGYVPAIRDTLQGFEKKVASGHRWRTVTHMRDVRNRAPVASPNVPVLPHPCSPSSAMRHPVANPPALRSEAAAAGGGRQEALGCIDFIVTSTARLTALQTHA